VSAKVMRDIRNSLQVCVDLFSATNNLCETWRSRCYEQVQMDTLLSNIEVKFCSRKKSSTGNLRFMSCWGYPTVHQSVIPFYECI
jgi:hypothetical protein